MEVFISWSGSVSQNVAIALRDWLPNVIQAIKPFVSSEDIQRGSRWSSDIGSRLENIDFGILCITPDNLNAPWILFEAGALSKSVDQSRVAPLLIGMNISDLVGPLAQFNAVMIEEADVFKLLQTINEQVGDSALPEAKLEQAFEMWWPELESSLTKAESEPKASNESEQVSKRTESDILEEILELTRGISRNQVQGRKEDEAISARMNNLLSTGIASIPKNYLTINDFANLKGNEIGLQGVVLDPASATAFTNPASATALDLASATIGTEISSTDEDDESEK